MSRRSFDVAGFVLPSVVLGVSLLVIVGRDFGLDVTTLQFGLACAFGALATVALLLSLVVGDDDDGASS